MRQEDAGFGFGIETEYLLIGQNDLKSLWINDLELENLLSIVDSIDTSDLSLYGLNQKPLHRKRGHYLIEGYTLTTPDFSIPLHLLPKGIEARTSICSSPQAAVYELNTLRTRLDERLKKEAWSTASVGHHPRASEFDAPRNYEREDYWNWARVATATYGPDFNISLPVEMTKELDLAELNDKINFYMPAFFALTFNSPFLAGNEAISQSGQTLLSVRTKRRSLWAPLYYIHRGGEAEDQSKLRFEFKGFEMAPGTRIYQALFMVAITVLTNKKLPGRCSDSEAQANLQRLALTGPDQPEDKDLIRRVIDLIAADQSLENYFYIDRCSLEQELKILEKRVFDNRLPAHELLLTARLEGSIERALLLREAIEAEDFQETKVHEVQTAKAEGKRLEVIA
ncbi:MAG: hypothetical protein K2Y32_05435 [Candidatus Obscuribacterales bacterium]|nr:hypothetical protein [Candidatus Obscuribacterales bacterium]